MQNKPFITFNPNKILEHRLFFVIGNQIMFKYEGKIVLTQIVEDEEYTADDYFLLPENAPYQLINGKLVFMSAPTPNHQEVVLNIAAFLKGYLSQNNVGKVYVSPIDVRFDGKNIIQPDLLFISIKKKHIIQKTINGVPEFVVEILSPSTENYDRNHKLPLFGKHGVEECWLISLKAEEVEVYHNKNNEMQLTQKAQKQDTIKSLAIKGFEMEVSRIFES